MEYTLYAAKRQPGMGESVPLGRACGLCGEQVILSVDTESATTPTISGGYFRPVLARESSSKQSVAVRPLGE